MQLIKSNNLIKLAAAGSGKTFGLARDVLLNAADYKNDMFLMITYTNNGVYSLQKNIQEQNNGVVPCNVYIESWYRFLLKQMIKPYQSILFKINSIRSIDFNNQYGKVNYYPKNNKKRYITSEFDLKVNFVSELAEHIANIASNINIKRLEKVYRCIYIDEIQDLAGYDFEILKRLFKSSIEIVCVGDYKQSTYKTNESLKNHQYNKNMLQFFDDQRKDGLIAIEYNPISQRFNRKICTLANKVYLDGTPIHTSMNEVTEHDGVYLIERKDAIKYQEYYKAKALIYDKRTKAEEFNPISYGSSKGLTFDRILIFPNSPLKKFLKGGFGLSSPEKYYVAVTRARYSIAFVVDSLSEFKKFENCILKLGFYTINAKIWC